jgi:hypothetical protein
MRRSLTTSLAVLSVLAVLTAGEARAQFPFAGGVTPPYARPAVSPYLNLFRAGSPAGINYYDLVRPQVQVNRALYGLQQQVGTLGQQVTAEGEGTANLLATGHRVGFMTHLRYFQNLGGQGGARTPLGAARPIGQGNVQPGQGGRPAQSTSRR